MHQQMKRMAMVVSLISYLAQSRMEFIVGEQLVRFLFYSSR